MNVALVRDTDFGYDPREYSTSAALEKPARAAIKVCAHTCHPPRLLRTATAFRLSVAHVHIIPCLDHEPEACRTH
jgi:hypothetical protein